MAATRYIGELPDARAAFVTRGGQGFVDLLAQRFVKATSASELRAMAPMTLRAAQHALQVADPSAGDGLLCKLAMIGWSDAGPIAFTIGTDRFRVVDIPYLYATPTPPSDDLLALVAGGADIGEDEEWQALDTDAAALRLIAARGGSIHPVEVVTIDAAGSRRHTLPPLGTEKPGHC